MRKARLDSLCERAGVQTRQGKHHREETGGKQCSIHQEQRIERRRKRHGRALVIHSLPKRWVVQRLHHAPPHPGQAFEQTKERHRDDFLAGAPRRLPGDCPALSQFPPGLLERRPHLRDFRKAPLHGRGILGGEQFRSVPNQQPDLLRLHETGIDAEIPGGIAPGKRLQVAAHQERHERLAGNRRVDVMMNQPAHQAHIGDVHRGVRPVEQVFHQPAHRHQVDRRGKDEQVGFRHAVEDEAGIVFIVIHALQVIFVFLALLTGETAVDFQARQSERLEAGAGLLRAFTQARKQPGGDAPLAAVTGVERKQVHGLFLILPAGNRIGRSVSNRHRAVGR